MSADQGNPDESQSLSLLQEIDDACDDFEDRWRADQKPRIEDYVARASERVRTGLVQALLRVEIACRRERGDSILPRDYDSYPEYASLIDELLGRYLTCEPGPNTAAMLFHEREALLRGFPKLFRDVLERRLKDQPVVEIAKQLGVSRRAVYRVLDVLKERLRKSADTGKW
jgi:hypothetical protein